MSHALQDRTAVVTGGARGIGRAIALELAAAGLPVALVARSRDALEETAEQIAQQGGTAHVIVADLGHEEERQRVAAEATDALGRVDVLVNNAGVLWPMRESPAMDMTEWSAAIAINVAGVAGLTFALLPGMVERGFGRVVNVSSGVVAYPAAMIGGNAYVTGKAAVEAHTLNLAAELDGTGVTVNVYRPGAVETDMQRWVRSQDPGEIGTRAHAMFNGMKDGGILITPEASGEALVRRLDIAGDATGAIWDVTDAV
jgi:3-oxoacyl-[acyl-carrier protein] reductase